MKAIQGYLTSQLTNSGYATKPLTHTDILVTMNFTDHVLEDIQAKYTEVSSQVQRLQKTLDAVTAALANLASAPVPPTTFSKQLMLHILSTRPVWAAQKLVFHLRYQAGPASWRPHYDLALLPGQHPATCAVRLAYWAGVTQRTGEHWEDVALRLASAAPRELEPLPRALRRTVQLRTPTPPMAYANMKSQARSYGGDIAISSGASLPESGGLMFFAAGAAPGDGMMSDAPVLLEGDAQAVADNAAFALAHRVTINSTASGVATAGATSRVRFEPYAQTPSSEEQGVLVAQLSADAALLFSFAVLEPGVVAQRALFGASPAQWPAGLRAGEARVSIGGVAHGTVALSSLAPGSPFFLGLGPDPAVSVRVEEAGPTNTKERGPDAKGPGSSWLVFPGTGGGADKDKKQLLRRLEERRVAVRVTGGAAGQLVVLSDSVPRSAQPGEVTVDLLTPAPASCLSSFPDTGTQAQGRGEEDFLHALLRHEMTLLRSGGGGAAAGSAQRCYYSPLNQVLYWALYFPPASASASASDSAKDSAANSAQFSVKYHVTWPADQQITIT